ncbi:hypothetical protein [Rubinisphaera margarita]|uniref:hypothetical protein n=1 Tax=Rubinisphaera margarita TaxID=2909586 RepID=UPI001EE86748|nr:hypothetical protein [Rubinisphaera margarita]MCG6155297.1 hypothetical protein [Rubinisphaera margarita]
MDFKVNLFPLAVFALGFIELLLIVGVLIGIVVRLNMRTGSKSNSESGPGFWKALFQGNATLTCWHCGKETDALKPRCQHCDRELK